MAKLHKHLSDTAIRLSVYSSVLDFGLAISVAFIPRNGPLGFLTGTFTNALTYLTLAIIALFSTAFVLKHRERIVNIPYTRLFSKPEKPGLPGKIKIYAKPHIPTHVDERKAVMKVPSQVMINDLAVQHVTNQRNESFIKYNGVWYKAGENRFEQVARPEYDHSKL